VRTSVVALLAVLIVAFSSPAFAHGDLQTGQSTAEQSQPTVKLDAPSIYKQAKDAIVVIRVHMSNGSAGFGSGVVVSPDGLIATNYHVIQDADAAQVRLANGDLYDDVAVLTTDPRKDIAILRNAVNLRSLEFGDSDRVQVGAAVYALGAPEGLESTFSQGLVSAIRPADELGLVDGRGLTGFRVIQITAPISHGSSGGALLDDTGKIVGLTAIGSGQGAQNLNFAIPSNYVRGLVSAPSITPKALARVSAISPTPTIRNDGQSAIPRSVPEIIASSRTIYVSCPNNPVLVSEVTKKLLEWGRLNIMSSAKDADLVMKLVTTSSLNAATGAGHQASALVTDQVSGVQFWTTRKGGSWAMSGWSRSWVGRQIADEFIHFFDQQLKVAGKEKSGSAKSK
jgi:hypothetical protein